MEFREVIVTPTDLCSILSQSTPRYLEALRVFTGEYEDEEEEDEEEEEEEEAGTEGRDDGFA